MRDFDERSMPRWTRGRLFHPRCDLSRLRYRSVIREGESGSAKRLRRIPSETRSFRRFDQQRGCRCVNSTICESVTTALAIAVVERNPSSRGGARSRYPARSKRVNNTVLRSSAPFATAVSLSLFPSASPTKGYRCPIGKSIFPHRALSKNKKRARK